MRETPKENDIVIERECKRGDLVMVREEWLDPGEDRSMKYVVLETMGSRILVQALGTGLAIAPTYVYDVAWVRYAGSVPPELMP